jgi:hypothetical protein
MTTTNDHKFVEIDYDHASKEIVGRCMAKNGRSSPAHWQSPSPSHNCNRCRLLIVQPISAICGRLVCARNTIIKEELCCAYSRSSTELDARGLRGS